MKTAFQGRVFAVAKAQYRNTTPLCRTQDGQWCAGYGHNCSEIVPDCTTDPHRNAVFLPAQLAVGDEFWGETSTGRVIKNAAVLALDKLPTCGREAMHVRWEDENGKHYEWFEFSEFVKFHFI